MAEIGWQPPIEEGDAFDSNADIPRQQQCSRYRFNPIKVAGSVDMMHLLSLG
jgi:hypothetical protein